MAKKLSSLSKSGKAVYSDTAIELFLKLFGKNGTYYGTISFVALLSIWVFYI